MAESSEWTRFNDEFEYRLVPLPRQIGRSTHRFVVRERNGDFRVAFPASEIDKRPGFTNPDPDLYKTVLAAIQRHQSFAREGWDPDYYYYPGRTE